ncbi:hypothetical protein [Streptomyces bacillaris]|uniref:hypothetical protein n=1 Tax=Streptomyces bacillaris TaxID=68179 RepID=UPI003460E771
MTSPKVPTPRRNYSSGTIAGLMTLACGGCYWPSCNEPTVRMVKGTPVQNLIIAHIVAFEDNGPRAEPTWTTAQRNHFSNLLLLCTVHHKEVDGPNSKDYPAELLQEWKSAREADGVDALEGLGDLTKADLGEMIREAQAEFVVRVDEALGEFAKAAPELASLLRLATAEFADRALQRPSVSEDTAMLLYQAANSLRGLEDNANVLSGAANDLRGLEDNANTLAGAADDLRGLEDKTMLLAAATQRLRGLPDTAIVLDSVVDRLASTEGQAGALNDAARTVQQAANEVFRAVSALNDARYR